MRLAEALADLTTSLTPHSESAVLEAQVLLGHILKKTRTWVISHPEFELTLAQESTLAAIATRRLAGEPLPYILGHWEFYGLDFLVTPAVLIPRPETELLVEQALGWLYQHPHCRKVADIGTGSGCIAISLAANLPDLNILASDISSMSLEIAQRNAQRHQVSKRITFVQADLLELSDVHCSLPFDLIAANLPYIPIQTLRQLPVSRSEPKLALDGGEDGLDLIQRLIQTAPAYLSPHSCMLLEIEARQGAVARELAQATFPRAQIQILPDLAGHDRLLKVEIN